MFHIDPPELTQKRSARLRQAAEDLDIASWVFTRSRSVGFATGVRPTAIDGTGELCAPMVAVGDTVLQSATSIADPGFFDELVDLLPARGTIAIDRWTVSSRARLAQLRPELRIVDAAGLLDRAKRTLDPAEVAVMADALHRTEASFLASIRGAAGRTERDLAGIFHAEAAARGLGLQAEPVFSAHSVTRDAAPWLRGSWADAPPYRGRTTERVLSEGDIVQFDGAVDRFGYAADLGWVFRVGDPAPTDADERLAARWREVALRVVAAARPGATSGDLAAAALRGWPENAAPPWPHALYVAHGIGTDVAQPPFAGADNGQTRIYAGQIFMVEPFVWEEGVGGYRAEYCIHVGDDKTRILNQRDVGYWPTSDRRIVA